MADPVAQTVAVYQKENVAQVISMDDRPGRSEDPAVVKAHRFSSILTMFTPTIETRDRLSTGSSAMILGRTSRPPWKFHVTPPL